MIHLHIPNESEDDASPLKGMERATTDTILDALLDEAEADECVLKMDTVMPEEELDPKLVEKMIHGLHDTVQTLTELLLTLKPQDESSYLRALKLAEKTRLMITQALAPETAHASYNAPALEQAYKNLEEKEQRLTLAMQRHAHIQREILSPSPAFGIAKKNFSKTLQASRKGMRITDLKIHRRPE